MNKVNDQALTPPTEEVSPLSYLEVLEGALALINSPDKWCQGAYAKNAHGQVTNITDPNAKQFCDLGALDRFLYLHYSTMERYGIEYAEPLYLILKELGYNSIGEFNDRNDYEDSMELYQTAIKNERQSPTPLK